MTITEFLTARYDEREADLRRLLDSTMHAEGVAISAPGGAVEWSANHELADIAAKRAIVADRPWPIGRFWDGQRAQHDSTLRMLVQPHTEHPDFDPGWRA